MDIGKILQGLLEEVCTIHSGRKPKLFYFGRTPIQGVVGHISIVNITPSYIRMIETRHKLRAATGTYIWGKAVGSILVIPIHCANSIELLYTKNLWIINNPNWLRRKEEGMEYK